MANKATKTQIGKIDNFFFEVNSIITPINILNLAPIQKKQEQHLKELNTQLCDYCLILCDFKYYDDCNLIYNLPLYIIYTIPKKDEPIGECTVEAESKFNFNSNFDNNDKNNDSSIVQNNNTNNNNLYSNSNSKQYIVLPNLFKKQKLKWFSNNDKNIMPKHTHNTDTGFDLKYPEKNIIKLEPYSHTCIDLKIALEILATIIVQIVSRSSLANKEINIKE
ncbi:hypothetical protein G9A89_008219 [Geosiphon pyriformis]|nr:hypothetical protein G9A89_008219 [Geosiphon pyriformis]